MSTDRPLVLVDGDPLAYKYGSLNDPALAEYQVGLLIGQLQSLGDVRVFLTSPSSVKGYRYHIAKTAPYQGTRSDSKGTFPCKGRVRAYLKSLPGTQETSLLEADDLLAQASREAPGSLIYSPDKDMMGLTGGFLRLEDPLREPTWVAPGASWWDPERKNYWGWKQPLYQILTGDRADNIKPILPSLKPKQAREILDASGSRQEGLQAVMDLLLRSGAQPERIVEQTALVALSGAENPAKRVGEFWGRLTGQPLLGTLQTLSNTWRTSWLQSS